MSTWLNETMCSTPDFIPKTCTTAYYRSLTQSAELKNKLPCCDNQLPGRHSGRFPGIRIKILWVTFISKCRKGILYRLLCSHTQTLNAREKPIVPHRNKPFRVMLRRTRIKARFSLSTLNSKNFQDLQRRIRLGPVLVRGRFSFVLWTALTPRRVP